MAILRTNCDGLPQAYNAVLNCPCLIPHCRAIFTLEQLLHLMVATESNWTRLVVYRERGRSGSSSGGLGGASGGGQSELQLQRQRLIVRRKALQKKLAEVCCLLSEHLQTESRINVKSSWLVPVVCCQCDAVLICASGVLWQTKQMIGFVSCFVSSTSAAHEFEMSATRTLQNLMLFVTCKYCVDVTNNML